MATSSGGFWRSAAGRWISSSKNILGASLGTAALGAEALFGLGPLWPAVVVASYFVGVLVAPRDRVDLRLQVGSGGGASADDLQDQLKLLRRSMTGEARRLTDDANAVLLRIITALDDIVARWDELASAPDQQHVVEQMVLDYIPTSVQTYLNLPRTFALSSRVEGKRSAHDELMEQLLILEKESDRIRSAVYERAVDALGDQSRFLRQKFGKSELEL